MVSGKDAAVVLENLPGGFLEIPHPCVISKALPQLVEQVRLRLGQSVHGGQGVEKPQIVPFDRFHAGLL